MPVLGVLLAASVAATPALAAPPASALCAALTRHVDATGGGTQSPIFLRSYEPAPGETKPPEPLASSAFAYDNALAIMALVACGDVPRARRIGDAFVAAIGNDRTFTDGRVRNAYRTGPVRPGPALLPGWWDSKGNHWAEDAYQDGTQTGNVAWVALALLTLDKAAHAPQYRATAEGLARWIVARVSDKQQPGGFSGGEAGFDPTQAKLLWRSTEHNVDTYALGTWLNRLNDTSEGKPLVDGSRRFLDAMYDKDLGMFRLGTTPDGAVQPSTKVALDALIWPLIGVASAPNPWRRSFDFAQAHLATSGGFDFNGDRDGIWTEGTAQASLVARALGHPQEADALLKTVLSEISPSGYLYATNGGRLTTGLPIGPDSETDDFFYFHRPHLGATAWAILAAEGFNPFTGDRID